MQKLIKFKQSFFCLFFKYVVIKKNWSRLIYDYYSLKERKAYMGLVIFIYHNCPYSTFGCGNVAQALQNITMLPLYCRLHCNIPAISWKHCRAILQWPRLCNVSGILRTHCRAILQCPRLCNISGILRTHCRAILQCPRLCNISGILRTHCRAILQWQRLCNVSAMNPK